MASSRVLLEVAGVTPNATYPAHVHNLPCTLQNGGAHYKRSSAETATLEANELWLDFTAKSDGTASSELAASHIARADARSIVIHDSAADGARLACIDLHF
jgi:hypothetical protein